MLGSFGAARTYYGQALTYWPADDPGRPQLLLKIGKTAQFAAAHAEARESLRHASEALEVAGDVEGAVEAQAILGEVEFESVGVASALEHLERAVSLARELPPSRAKAHSLSAFGRVLLFAGRTDDAIERAREALDIAEQLELADLRAQALLNLGTARWRAGDPRAADDIRQSIDVALAANSPACLRGYWNLGVFLFERGDIDDALQIAADGRRTAEQFGVPEQVAILSVFEVPQRLGRAEWVEALALWDDVERTVGPGKFLVDHMRHFIAAVTAVTRGELELGVRAASAGVEHARKTRPDEPETVGDALLVQAWALWEAGRRDEAQALAPELDATLAKVASAAIMLSFSVLGLVLAELRLDNRLRKIAGSLLPSPWKAILECHVLRDLGGAADVYAQLGLRFPEALLRIRAAEEFLSEGRRREADEQLERALPILRSIEATHFVRKGESLLAASA
jgi:tetratricopeptide (TPR) repeat protein